MNNAKKLIEQAIPEARKTNSYDQRLRDYSFSAGEVAALHRAAKILHRWCEMECGDSDDYASTGIERDEKTGQPYRVVMPHRLPASQATRTPIRDGEEFALDLVKRIMSAHPEFVFYYQSDPRGCPLYILPDTEIQNEPIENVYSRGVPVC